MRLKSAEMLLKRATNGAIATLMGRSARGERPDWRERPYRVLFLRHDRIGDMILSTGILRAIAQSHPTIRLDVLASKTNAPVLKNEPYLNEIIAFDKKATRKYPGIFGDLRRKRYDAVIDCMVTAPSTTTLLLMLARDRKSTRLNSSHSQISYAVFCLKKKKRTGARLVRREGWAAARALCALADP